MKKIILVLSLVTASMLAFTACNKNDVLPQSQMVEQQTQKQTTSETALKTESLGITPAEQNLTPITFYSYTLNSWKVLSQAETWIPGTTRTQTYTATKQGYLGLSIPFKMVGSIPANQARDMNYTVKITVNGVVKQPHNTTTPFTIDATNIRTLGGIDWNSPDIFVGAGQQIIVEVTLLPTIGFTNAVQLTRSTNDAYTGGKSNTGAYNSTLMLTRDYLMPLTISSEPLY